MARVLVVEDDAHIRDLIVLHLGLEGLDSEAIGDVDHINPPFGGEPLPDGGVPGRGLRILHSHDGEPIVCIWVPNLFLSAGG